MIKAMIVSVGGSDEPIKKSLSHFRPSSVCFFVSKETKDQALELVNALDSVGIRFEYWLVTTSDAQDLQLCYETSMKCVAMMSEKGFDKNDVRVDYTGGTKNMTAALALATVRAGFSYAYVGGSERTKGGVGIVVDGHERITESFNPWDLLGEVEKERVALLFNAGQFAAAEIVAGDAAARSTRNRELFKMIKLAAEAYGRWDLFEYETAKNLFRQAKLDRMPHDTTKGVTEFVRATLDLIGKLETLIVNSNSPSLPLIHDMFANADRRYEQGRRDDAIVRLYRVSEMIEQERLLTGWGIDTKDAGNGKTPLPESFIKLYNISKSGAVKLGHRQGYVLLDKLGDPLGAKFVRDKKAFEGVENARNNGYLAHGFGTSKKSAYKSLREFILSLGVVVEADIVRFPRLTLG